MRPHVVQLVAYGDMCKSREGSFRLGREVDRRGVAPVGICGEGIGRM